MVKIIMLRSQEIVLVDKIGYFSTIPTHVANVLVRDCNIPFFLSPKVFVSRQEPNWRERKLGTYVMSDAYCAENFLEVPAPCHTWTDAEGNKTEVPALPSEVTNML